MISLSSPPPTLQLLPSAGAFSVRLSLSRSDGANMAILSNVDIRSKLGDSIIIEPFDNRNVNTSSYDVTLGENYYIEREPLFAARRPQGYNIWDYEAVQRVWQGPYLPKTAREVFGKKVPGIHPGEFVIQLPPQHSILAHTREFIGGRYNVTTMMKARSSFGRNFIAVCSCAGYGDVGYINRWTMEIHNRSLHYTIPLVVGRRIAQIVFMSTGDVSGNYSTTGKYQQIPDIDELMARWEPSTMLPRLDLDRDNPDLGPRDISNSDD